MRSYAELFGGYADPKALLEKAFEDVGGYDELVLLRDIRVVSCCEHHMLPIIGKAHIGYLPDRRVVGISKLAQVVDGFAQRLQIQEKMAAQIAGAIRSALKPRGVGVVLEAEHCCMTLRGVQSSRGDDDGKLPAGRHAGRRPHARRIPAPGEG